MAMQETKTRVLNKGEVHTNWDMGLVGWLVNLQCKDLWVMCPTEVPTPRNVTM